MYQFILAQNDTITIKEVVISDNQLHKFSNSISVLQLNDSIIKKNKSSLTSLLNYNSTIYFKENGLGMVSSPSFRGTTAQQTAVIWNGININSQLNGQTDFNTIATQNFDDITIRSGGGSAIYGSSAIGGSIHLNNELTFKNQFQNELFLTYGSFNTIFANYKMNVSNEKFSSQVAVSRNSSTNDYNYLETNKKNENAQFYNTSLNASFGYKVNKFNFLKLYSQVFESVRHFSGTLASVSKSKYQDVNTRNLLEWDSFFNRFSSKLKMVFLSEKYKYFENFKSDNFETSKAETFITKYDLGYNFNSKMHINAILDYTKTKGFGENIGENTRSISSATVLFKHNVFEKLEYELSCRKEITSNYKSPILFSFGSKYQITKNYNLVLNFSRNFRIPTFNDLYWNGLGNPNLQPEKSNQIEIGQQLKHKNWFVSATVYYLKIDDLIQWKPNATNGNWNPNNVAKVTSYGAEMALNYKNTIGKNKVNFNANYGYVVSEDDTTKLQLVYVPFHKLNSALVYSYKKLGVNYQYLYTGYVFTSSDTNYFLKSYHVSNLGIDYDFGKTQTYKLGFQVSNIWNENYQSVANRPMPGRNYSIHLIFNF